MLSSGFYFRIPKIRKRTSWRFTRPGTCWPPTQKSWTSGFPSRRTTSLMGTTSTWTSYHIRSASRTTSCTQSQTTSPTPSPRASQTSSSSLTGTPSSLLPQGTELWVWWFWVTLHGVTDFEKKKKKDFQLFECKSFTTQAVIVKLSEKHLFCVDCRKTQNFIRKDAYIILIILSVVRCTTSSPAVRTTRKMKWIKRRWESSGYSTMGRTRRLFLCTMWDKSTTPNEHEHLLTYYYRI